MKELLFYIHGIDVDVVVKLVQYMAVAVVFMAFDVITGLTSAIITGTYKSKIMREGGKHKLVLIMAILFGVLLDLAQAIVDIGITIPATLLISGYIIIMEIGSCKENIMKAYNKALPSAVSEAIDTAVKKAEGGKEDEDD